MRWAMRIGGALVAVLVLVAGTVYAMSQSRIDATFDVPAWTGKAPPTSEEVLARGAHVATVRGCLDCHRPNAAGGLFADAMPVMRLVPPNISPGGVTKSYTDADWERAIRHGVRPDGRGIPFMPSIDNAHLSDDDLGALIAYMRSLPPAADAHEPTSIGPLGRVLFVMGELPYLHAELIDHTAPDRPAPTPGPTAEYGAYLAEACAGCHGSRLSGGPIPGVPPDWPEAANLTPHASGLGGWTEAQFTTALTTGVRPDGRQIDPQHMPWKQFSKLTADEVQALWLHLRTIEATPLAAMRPSATAATR